MRLWLVVFMACAGSKDTTATDPVDGDADTDADADSDADTDADPGPQFYAADVAPLLEDRCVGCHFEPTAAALGGFSFDDERDLIDVPSVDVPAMPYVTANEPENSYLYHKVANTHLTVGGAGARMPTGPALRPADVRILEAWIRYGAQP